MPIVFLFPVLVFIVDPAELGFSASPRAAQSRQVSNPYAIRGVNFFNTVCAGHRVGSGGVAAPARVDEYDLAVIMKDIGNFDMDTFKGRLSFQKTVYLLQYFGVYLGYDFGWYIHGTYSPALTRAGFKIRDLVKRMPEIDIRFASDEAQANYGKFKEFIEDKKDDPALLEIGASLCYLARLKLQKERMLELVAAKKPHFTTDQCVRVWADLEKHGVVNA